MFWSNYPSRKMMQLILRKHWKLWVVGNHVDPKASYCNKTSEEDCGCTNCLCMEDWYRTGCSSGVSQLYNQLLQGLLTTLSSCVGMRKLGRRKEDEWKKFIALYVRMKQQFAL